MIPDSTKARTVYPCSCRRFLLLLFLVILGQSALAQSERSLMLVGAGSSVPLPLYRAMAAEYNQASRAVSFDYIPAGTTDGISHLGRGVADFAAGEVPLKAEDRGPGVLIEIPVVLIGIVPIYNVPGIDEGLKFSGELLAQIFLGEVKNWSSPQIARLNPGVNLPHLPIKVVYRPAGKGSNYVFSEFLSKTSARFRTRIGTTPSPEWPVGSPAERSSDMAEKIKGEKGSIGYVELQYAVQNNIMYGLVLNPAGKFIKATSETILAACAAVESPVWDKLSVSLTNSPGADSFPIASFSWIYVRTKLTEHSRSVALADLLVWMLTSGQQLVVKLGYSQLPKQLRDQVKLKIESLR